MVHTSLNPKPYRFIVPRICTVYGAMISVYHRQIAIFVQGADFVLLCAMNCKYEIKHDIS